MKPVQVIINEQHSLMEEQEQILNDRFGQDWELFKVSSAGWTLEEMDQKIKELRNCCHVVFASPIPYMLMRFTEEYYHCIDPYNGYFCGSNTPQPHIFHNDNREKKELPNGRIVMTVAQTGWQLV